MAQPLKCEMLKTVGLYSDLDPYKPVLVVKGCDANTGEVETKGSLGLAGQLV